MLQPGSRVLIVGGASEGIGLRELLGRPGLEVLETDVVRGPRTQLVCDAHDLPLADGCVDLVICQGVLSFVLDPQRVVEQMHRVLRPGALIYTEVPFMQQVCNGAFDFTRWTPLGHRRLLRDFDVLRSGASGGPGMALAWSFSYFLMAFAGRSRAAHRVARLVGAILGAPLTLFDSYLARTPGGLDAASGSYILGRRRETPLPDAEIIAQYEGLAGAG
jgi:SAM-dependent methyltransferase